MFGYFFEIIVKFYDIIIKKLIKIKMENRLMKKEIVLTGDRPTGKLHIGHYVGSLKNRVLMQNEGKYEMFIFMADMQALTDHAKDPKLIRTSVTDVALDYLACGIDPTKSTIFIQSQIPELSDLTMYYMNLVTLARLERNPTVKTEIKQKDFGMSIPVGFLNYPISQASDITAFKAKYVPVGEDQLPMLEQAREIVHSFNRTYNTDVLVEPEAILPPKEAGRLPGIDGNAKMSKSLDNAIYLADDYATLKKKVMSMYTDPEHIRIEDPGHVEGNMVFHYLDVFGKDKVKIQEMKDHYMAGGLGDVKVKKYLLEVLEEELGPIRERRIEFAKDIGEVHRMLKVGSEKARAVAAQTLDECKTAMGINYFKN
jgi:tryptophanyl-tRNA synthetase